MNKFLAATALVALMGVPALAQERSEYEEDRNGVFDAPVTLALDAGVLSYDEPANAGDAIDSLEDNGRFVGGLRLNWDLTNMGSSDAFHLGFGTGLYYSRVGEENAVRSNFFMVPLNLQIGVSPGGLFHLAVHGGVNGIVDSDEGAVDLGDTGRINDNLRVHPAVGANLGIGLGKGVGLSLRGDYTITNATDLLSATAGLVFPLG